MWYVGMDVHKAYCSTVVMDKEGQILARARIPSQRGALEQFFGRFDQPLHVAMEACYSWGYFADLLDGLVEEITLAHPAKTRLIAEARIKTDELDARALADLLRTNLLPKAYQPPAATRAVKEYLRYRCGLVRLGTAMKNKVHALLAQHEYAQRAALESCSDWFGKRGRALLAAVELPGDGTTILRSWLALWETVEAQVREADRWIRAHVASDAQATLLASIPGVGPFCALLIRYEIDAIERFANAKKLTSYAGLCPSTYSSGGKTFHGSITRQGNRWLRWALVEAAQQAPRHSAYFGRTYLRLRARAGGARARVATARKLVEIVYGVMKTQTPYREPICEQSRGSHPRVALVGATGHRPAVHDAGTD